VGSANAAPNQVRVGSLKRLNASADVGTLPSLSHAADTSPSRRYSVVRAFAQSPGSGTAIAPPTSWVSVRGAATRPLTILR
jgi:hypothetical protein